MTQRRNRQTISHRRKTTFPTNREKPFFVFEDLLGMEDVGEDNLSLDSEIKKRWKKNDVVSSDTKHQALKMLYTTQDILTSILCTTHLDKAPAMKGGSQLKTTYRIYVCLRPTNQHPNSLQTNAIASITF